MAGHAQNIANIEPWELCPKITKNHKFGFDDFKKESDLCDYLEINIKNVCADILEETYVSHEREWQMNKHGFGPRGARVDFKIETMESELVLLECKNPRNTYAELVNSVSQMMGYDSMCRLEGMKPDRHIILTTRYHYILGKIINNYSLPFEIYVLNKGQIYRYYG